MRDRTHPLTSAAYAGSLAAAVVLGANWAASAASGCIERPNQQIDQGHWYYHFDRVHHRRCWRFETSETTAGPAPSPDLMQSPNADSQSSWFSQLTAGLAQTFSVPQQNSASVPHQDSAPNDSGTTTNIAILKHPKPHKAGQKERPRTAPFPVTTGAAVSERGDQSPLQSPAERNEIQPSQLAPADREALYREFLEWYVDRKILGRP